MKGKVSEDFCSGSEFALGLGMLSSTYWGSSAHDDILNNPPDISYVPGCVGP